MSTVTPNPQEVHAALGRALHDHWGLFLTEGIILVILGVIAIVVPPLATLAATIVIGWLFVISGIAGLIMAFQARHAPGFWWALLSAVIALVAGGLLLWQPLVGVLSLTFVLIAFFLIDGVLSIFLAIEHRRVGAGTPRRHRPRVRRNRAHHGGARRAARCRGGCVTPRHA